MALDQKISTSSILKGLKDLEMTKMRTALLKVHDAKIIDDTYKSNPESAKAAIDTLMKVQAKKTYSRIGGYVRFRTRRKRSARDDWMLCS